MEDNDLRLQNKKTKTIHDFFGGSFNVDDHPKQKKKTSKIVTSKADNNNTSNRLAKSNLKFNLKWCEEFEWLHYKETEEGGRMFCAWCDSSEKKKQIYSRRL